MERGLRIEFNGALYHVTSRGGRREPIYEDDEGRKVLLLTLTEVVFQYPSLLPPTLAREHADRSRAILAPQK